MEVVVDDQVPSTSTGINECSVRLGDCEVCNVAPAKYTCPRCEVKTCCLKCSQIHKKELECDGSRDRTKYIPKDKFSEMDLSSDYKLLEEMTRALQKCQKDRKKFDARCSLPKHLWELKKSSKQKNVQLKFLPYGFQRRMKNTTVVNFHKDVIFWHIEWVFASTDGVRFTDEKVRETERLSGVLHKYFLKQSDAVLQEKLQYYQSADLSGVRLFLRAECRAGKKYYELDPLETLKENFAGKTIIEYPIIYVVLKEHADAFSVIDSDDEDNNNEENVKLGSKVIQDIIKKSESEDSIYNGLKNLLFLSDEEEMITG